MTLAPVASAQRIIIPAEGEGGPPVLPTQTGTQIVFLDFDSGTLPGDHIYTASERSAILAAVSQDYGLFDFSFTQTTPTSGIYSTITFNTGPIAGIAEAIDFRNLDRSDNATVNLNGVIGDGATFPLPESSDTWVTFSANVASHELGHLVGLRHGDSFGPIGTGLPSTGLPGTGRPSPTPNHSCSICSSSHGSTLYGPFYEGPENANFSVRHIMASGGSIGQPISVAAGQVYFGVREAIKLKFNESGQLTAETSAAHGDAASAQALTLPTLIIPNTLEDPNEPNFGKALTAGVETVFGSIAAGGQKDYYSFMGTSGDVIFIEVMSQVLDRITNSVDTVVTVYGADGVTPINYYGTDATNDDEFETTDSVLIDLVLETTGKFFIEVAAFSEFDTGNYELFVYRFDQAITNMIPEPGTLILLGCGSVLIVARRRKSRQAA